MEHIAAIPVALLFVPSAIAFGLFVAVQVAWAVLELHR